jgi:membrane associated rhomboid family serine protease
MATRPRLLSRPLYEGLPWLYIVLGAVALLGSYLLAARGVLSFAVGALGLLAILAGAVVLLRRRDYRELRSHYSSPGELERKDL